MSNVYVRRSLALALTRLGGACAVLCACLLLTPATADAAVVQQVQSGTAVNSANGTQTINISGVDPSKSFLIFETRHASNRPVAAQLRGRIPVACANPCTTIEFVRVTDEGAPAAINIQWYVVTFVSGVTVQRGEVAQSATSVNVTLGTTLSSVNQAFLLWSKTPTNTDTTWDGNDFVLGEITSTTNVQFRSDAAVASHTIYWQVVEFTNAADATVQKGTTAMTTAQTSVTATLGTAVDVNKTFVLVGYRANASAATNMGAMMLRAQLTNTTTITIDRSTVGAPAVAITEITWQAIELKDKSVVWNGTSNFAAAATQATVPLVPHVSTSRAIAFGSVQSGAGQNLGRSPYVADDIIGVGSATMGLSPTQLTLTRNNTAAAADVGWSVVEFEQADAKVLTGSYLGNGADNRGIDVGFVPDFVIVKSDATEFAVFRSSTMTGDNSKVAVGATALVANHIQSFDTTNGGRFVVGTDVRVNAAGTMYYWTAFKAGSGKMAVGTYTGNGGATQSISGLEFSPELVYVLPASAQDALHRSTPSSNAFDFGTGAPDATWIPSLDAAGFTVGSDARVNSNGVVYHYLAWNEVPGWMDIGTYTGNGAATQNITTVGFEPEYLHIRRDSGNFWTYNRPASLAGSTGDAAFVYDIFAQIAARVTQLLSNGFQVGNSTQTNNSGSVFIYHAWKRDSAPILLSGDYTGNGTTQAITGLGFQPDVVIIKTTAQVAQIRTSTMPSSGNNTKPFSGASALLGSRVTSLDGTGFTVGNSNTVNQNGTLYYFVAFKAAPGTMKVGTYTGNGLAGGQSITGVGFSPELVFVMSAGAADPVHRGQGLTETHTFGNSAGTVGWISTLDADGFTIGSNNAAVNSTGVTYHYVAWNAIPGEMVVNGYTGDGLDGKDITGVGFEPEYVIVKQVDAQLAVHHPASLGRSVDSSLHYTTQTNAADLIQALQPDGFEVGTDARVNTNAAAYRYYAWRRPYAAALTAVRLISFTATRAQSGRTLLRWKTGWEVDNLGFHVYREENGRRTRLTPSLIAGSALSLGRGVASSAERSYAWWDPNPGGANVRYFLADVDLNGRITWHGPIAAQVGDVAETTANSALLRETLRRASALGLQRAAAAIQASASNSRAAWPGAARASVRAKGRQAVTSPALARQQEIAAAPAVKIGVRTAGWYRVGRSQLIAAGLNASLDPRLLQLYVEGEELPIVVRGEEDARFDEQDYVEFYGSGVDTPYTDTRIYWLRNGNQFGLRIPSPIQFAELRTAPPAMPTGFSSIVERKDRTTYFAALQNGEAENFFGELVLFGEATPQALSTPHVDRAASGNASLEVTLQGVTDEEAAPDHRVAVVLNGVELGEVMFDGRAQGVAAFDVPHSLLLDGENVVTLESRASEVDTSLVDRLRLTYQRTHDAEGDALAFTADGGSLAMVRGFSNPAVRVFDLTDEARPVEVGAWVFTDAGAVTVEVRVPGAGLRRLVALTNDAFDAPPSILANQPSHWHDVGLAGSHVIVAHGSFIDSLAPLTALRESQGHAGALVDVEDIYDEFSFGEKTPFAIRDFLARAAAAWSRPPEFLVLAGNATNDPRDYYGLGEPDFVPTKLVPTTSLETASDDWFVDPDGDGQASIPVGRLPIRSAAEGAAIAAKIVNYEQSGDEPWSRNVLLVADENDPGADFEGLSSRLGQLLPPDYSPAYVFRAQSGSHAASELLQQINAGQVIVNFAGHGSVDVWGRRADILTSADVAAGWNNQSRLPFVVAMNCLNGFFHGLFPEESLAETLMRAQDKGAIAVWASSAVTETAAQASVNQRLFALLFGGDAPTIGQAALAAKRSVNDADLLRSWILFGDPALKLKGLTATSPGPTHSVGLRPVPDDDDASFSAGVERRKNKTGDNGFTGAPVPLRVGDFGGDRRADVLLYNAQTGQWRAVMSEGVRAEGEWPANWQVASGDFDGDRLLDVALYDPLTGGWFQARNEGLARFGYASGTWQTGGRLHVEDLNRDRRDDVVVADGRAGEPARLVAGGATVAIGDFDADGRDDYLLFSPSTGAWTLAFARDGGRFDYSTGTWSWARGWTLVGK